MLKKLGFGLLVLIAMGGLDKVVTETQPVPVYQEHLADMAPGKTIRDVHIRRKSASRHSIDWSGISMSPSNASITASTRPSLLFTWL